MSLMVFYGAVTLQHPLYIAVASVARPRAHLERGCRDCGPEELASKNILPLEQAR